MSFTNNEEENEFAFNNEFLEAPSNNNNNIQNLEPMRRSDVKPSMFNAGVNAKGDNRKKLKLMEIALTHDANLPTVQVSGRIYEILEIKCRNVKMTPVLEITKFHKARGARTVQALMNAERGVMGMKSVSRPKAPTKKMFARPPPIPPSMNRGSTSRALRDAQRVWAAERDAWFKKEKAQYIKDRAMYEKYSRDGVHSIDFNVRITDGDTVQGGSFTLYRTGAVRCSGGLFIDKYDDGEWKSGAVYRKIGKQVKDLQEVFRTAYAIPPRDLQISMVTGTFNAGFKFDDVSQVENLKKSRQISAAFNLRRFTKKSITNVSYTVRGKKREAAGKKGSLTIPRGTYSLNVTKSGKCQIYIKGDDLWTPLLSAGKLLTAIIPANAINRRKVVGNTYTPNRVSKSKAVNVEKKSQRVTRSGTTCPTNRCPKPNPFSFDSKCPEGQFVRPNPQGFPCCYKTPKSTPRAAKLVKNRYKKVTNKMPDNVKARFGINTNNKTARFLHVYGNHKYTISLFNIFDDFRHLATRDVVEHPEAGRGRRYLDKDVKSPYLLGKVRGIGSDEASINFVEEENIESLYRACIAHNLGSNSNTAREVPWNSTDPYPVDDFYINGRQAMRIPKTALFDILRRLKRMNIPATARKETIIHAIRIQTLGGPYDMTNRTPNKSLSVPIKRDRTQKAGLGEKNGKAKMVQIKNRASIKKVETEQVPVFMENRKLMIGKRVASTFSKPDLVDISRGFGIGGGASTTKDQLLTNMTSELKRRRAAVSASVLKGVQNRAAARKRAMAEGGARKAVSQLKKLVKTRREELKEVDTYLKTIRLVVKSGAPGFGAIYGSDELADIAKRLQSKDEILNSLRAAMKSAIRAGLVRPIDFELTAKGGLKGAADRVKRFISTDMQNAIYKKWFNSQSNAVKNFSKKTVGKTNKLPTRKRIIQFANKLNKKRNK